MGLWEIKVLYYGKITAPKGFASPGLDPDLVVDAPYLGFLLQNGYRNVLVDTGISEKFIVDGKAWAGFPAEGGLEFLQNAIAGAGLSPEDIDTVIFTHLHNDHAANADIFTKARLIFQKDEWKTMLDPLPVMKLRKDYDPGLIEDLKALNCLKVDGDFELTEGIRIIKTPGHTPGSQSIAVRTENGVKVIVGDHWIHLFNAFSKQEELIDMYGKKHQITPAPDIHGGFIANSLIYNYYDWYDSSYKIKAVMEADRPEFCLPGHEPSLLHLGL